MPGSSKKPPPRKGRRSNSAVPPHSCLPAGNTSWRDNVRRSVAALLTQKPFRFPGSVRSSGMYFPSVTTGASHLPAALCPLLCGYFFPSQLVAFFDGYSITTATCCQGGERSPDLFPVPPRPPLKWPVYRTVHSGMAVMAFDPDKGYLMGLFGGQQAASRDPHFSPVHSFLSSSPS